MPQPKLIGQFLRSSTAELWWRVFVGVGITSLLVFASGIQSPFEWDEILFARAVEGYDAAANSPHMPGYPAFVFAAKLTSLGFSSAVRAAQVTSLAAAFLTLALVFSLGQQLGLKGLQLYITPAILAVCPSFLWFAGVGLSDIAGTFGCGAVFWAILRGGTPIRSAVLTGLLAAIAIGLRTQGVYLMLPMAVIALSEWRSKTFLRCLAATVAFIFTSIVIWVSAIVVTGPSRWWEAFVWQLQWVGQERINGLALPYAPLDWIVQGWLVKPFGTPWLAAAFWSLVIAGAGILWHAERRRIVLYCLGLGLFSLVSAAFTLDLRNGPRYILPSILFFSCLIAGGIGNSSSLKKLVTAATVLFMAASVIWIFPGLLLRPSEMAPVMNVLEHIRTSTGPADTVIFYEGKLWPHAHWALEREGYEIYPIEQLEGWHRTHQGESRSLISVHSNRGPIPEGASDVADWDSPQVRAMTQGRYLRCWAVRH